MFKGFIFDLDGTVYRGDSLIPGADRVIRLLREKGKKVVFLPSEPAVLFCQRVVHAHLTSFVYAMNLTTDAAALH